ncbi:MAG TPA: hypothetical protein VGD10_03830 [Allosphingosinicella sp.]|uniref:hypothetical protein n=1 Tax=Allosphingosinicella sp. TaxID=2823234 RepID=UPI002EDB6B39
MTGVSEAVHRAAKSPYVRLLLAGTAIGSFAAAPAHAAGTQAGTTISNTATATYDLPGGGGEATINSNTVNMTVDELLDVSVAWADPGDVPASPSATARVLTFTVTNAGNGNEAFTLSTRSNGGGDDFDPTVTSIVLDTNGNGAYDAGVDTAYVAGSNDPVLAPDASTTVFVLSTIPGGAADNDRGRIDLVAVSNTGSGTAGTSIAGAGQGGGAAVIGATGGDAEDDGYYVVSSTAVALVKSATVADPFGGTTQVPGSTITYTLAATVSGTGSMTNLRITDPIPTGTTYKVGSIKLDGAALTDASDADAGRYTGTGINVGLGTVAAGTTRTVTFQVTIAN